MPQLPSALVDRFQAVLDAAVAAGEPEPTAMALATRDEADGVSVRIVLLKGIDRRGLRFFTHYEGRKGRQLAANPAVALSMHFKHLEEGVQLRVEGRATRLPATESDAYFATRPRLSQLGAWASRQSEPLASRSAFEARVAEFEQRFADREVPRPPHWGGFLVEPSMLEFWHARANRLHVRERFTWTGSTWESTLLYP